MKLYTVLAIGGLTLALTLQAAAHHSDAGLFDETRTVEMRVVVTEWRFVNPHPILRGEVTEADGQAVAWNVAFGPSAVSALRRRGFSPETFMPGEVLIVTGHPATAPGAHAINVRGPESEVTRGDGSPVP